MSKYLLQPLVERYELHAKPEKARQMPFREYKYFAMDSKEFFIRKAIGWILREYSKTDPGFVVRFVQSHELSGLSHREALKWLERQ